MRKQELIHLNDLFVQIHDHVETERGREIEHDAYTSEHPPPTSIHKSKTAHRGSVLALSADIASEVSRETIEA